jgi:phosphate-selective porin
MISTQISPDALLRRKQVAEALTSAGFPVAPASLATMVCRGGGPPYRTFGRVVLYKWGDALEWAEARMTAPRRSTSEADAVKDGRAAEV